MINKPAFNPIFHVETTADDTVFLFSESGPIILQSKAYARLAPLIDGQKTTDELVDLLQDQLPLTEIYYVLMDLEKKGYLVESDSTIPSHIAAFWHSFGVDTQNVVRRLQETTVSVTAFGNLDASTLVDKLTSLSIQVGESGDLDIVLTDDYLREELRLFNDRAIANNRPWLLAKPVGNTLWLGPLFNPETTGCWTCLEQRLRIHRNAETFVQRRKSSKEPIVTSRAALPTTLQTALELIATETAKAIILPDDQQQRGTLISFDLRTLQTEQHTLVRRPQCPVCGDAEYFSHHHQPIELQSQIKQAGVPGGDRVVTPEQTLQTYGHHVSPITGILSQLTRSGDRDVNSPIHNYVAGLNHAVSEQDSVHTLRNHLRTNSGGKGTTEAQAKAGALAEAIERFSFRFQGDEHRIQASFQELGELAIHPNQCMLFSDYQFDNREELNRLNKLPGRQIPRRFDERRTMEWTPAWSLTEQTFKYLPTGHCFYGYPMQHETHFYKADSNGSAAGNTIEEAILQGFFELVERDSVAIWWYNRLSRGIVDLDSFNLPYITRLQEYYRSLNRELWVLDVTHDLEVPSFVAVSRATDQPMEKILCGFGAHFNPEIALLRALTEMNQFLPNLWTWEQVGHTDALTADWWQTATLENQPYLKPDLTLPAKKATDFHYVQHDDILEDVLHCQRIVERTGMEMLVLDYTRPDIGLPVVKVIVPGLRHFWNRFAPGRLYDVPVQMNWLSEPRHESELNPIFIMF